MTTPVGELTAGEVQKKQDIACRTCGVVGEKISPGGYCWDPHACAQRRMERVSGKSKLRYPCMVTLFEHGARYYLREFGPKILPPPNPLPKGFTMKDYEANPNHVYYEAVMEIGMATSFKPEKALALAKIFNGTVVNK
jgi:hypothetical protein